MKIITSLVILSLLNGSVSHERIDAPGIIGVRDTVIGRVITGVYFGSPAYCAGILVSDRIVSLKPESGKDGEPCTVIIRRGKERLTFNISREAKSKFYEGLLLTKNGVIDERRSKK